MRIVVIGTSGSGKTTMAEQIAGEMGLPHIELDALCWAPGWTALAQSDPDEFARRVSAAIAEDAWVVDGNYSQVRWLVWGRATHLVWLDYSRPLIMYRVIKRSIARALSQTELWAGTGNTENWRSWWRPSHPIRWAWSTWRRNRSKFEECLAREEYQHLVVLRCRRPSEAAGVVGRLKTVAA